MLPTPSHSQPRGSGVSTPPATCGARASQGRALACFQGQQTQQRPPGFLMPRAPPQNRALALLLPPPSVRWRVGRLERGASSQARVITLACRCLPSLRKRTGSLWSQLNTWTRPLPLPCWMGWSGELMRGRGLSLGAAASAPRARGSDQSGGHGAVRCQEGSVPSPPACSPPWPSQTLSVTASRLSVSPQCCAVWPMRCDQTGFKLVKKKKSRDSGGLVMYFCHFVNYITYFFNFWNQLLQNDYYIYCSLWLANVFSL